MNIKYDIQDDYLILTVEMGYAESSSVIIPLKDLAEGLDKYITHPKPVAKKRVVEKAARYVTPPKDKKGKTSETKS